MLRRSAGAEGRFRIVDGLDIYLRDEGQGPPLLLLHGFPFTHHSFRLVRAPLARRHRVLALDLPGFGDSDRPPAFAYDVVAYADLRMRHEMVARTTIDLIAGR